MTVRDVKIGNGIGLHLDWLRSSEVRLADGRLKSWSGDGGYPYDESLCYFIKLLDYCADLTGDDRYLEEVEPSLDHLRRIIEARAGIGREGEIYLFDTGICLATLSTHARITGQDLTSLMAPLTDTMVSMISEERAVLESDEQFPEDRWSRRFGPHLIKMVIPLLEAADLLNRPELRKTAKDLIEQMLEAVYREGIFYTKPDLARSYLHGHCYAVEGLIYAVASSLCDGRPLQECAERLASAQHASGGMPNWWNNQADVIEVSDTTAQAVRIWQCVDAKGFAKETRRGMEFLLALAGENGGIRYHQGSQHLNTWSTVFAVEAMLWDHMDPDPLWII